jgi:SAM-dependent methyltransferase
MSGVRLPADRATVLIGVSLAAVTVAAWVAFLAQTASPSSMAVDTMSAGPDLVGATGFIGATRDLARQKGVSIRTARIDMADLSRYSAGSFDVVWQCHSLVFVRNVRKIFREVGRVLARGGTYQTTTMHPITLRLYGRYVDGGWRPRLSYFDDRAMP